MALLDPVGVPFVVRLDRPLDVAGRQRFCIAHARRSGCPRGKSDNWFGRASGRWGDERWNRSHDGSGNSSDGIHDWCIC